MQQGLRGCFPANSLLQPPVQLWAVPQLDGAMHPYAAAAGLYNSAARLSACHPALPLPLPQGRHMGRRIVELIQKDPELWWEADLEQAYQ